jgi:hypothetical protein
VGENGCELSEKTVLLRPSEFELTVWKNVITSQIEDAVGNRYLIGKYKAENLTVTAVLWLQARVCFVVLQTVSMYLNSGPRDLN